MTENGIVASLLKMKAFGYFLVFWGLTFIVRAIIDLEYYLFNWGTETVLETTSWILNDVFSIVAGILIIIVAVKILRAKS